MSAKLFLDGGSAATRLIALGIALSLAATSAAAMDVATFLVKAQALKAKGALAMFSPDAGAMMGEINAATRSLREERVSAKAAGKPQAYCPPPSGKVSIKTEELVAAAETIPAAQRPHTDLKDVLRGYYAKRYPCPA